MRISELYKTSVKYFTNKSNFIDMLFYLLASGALWYWYNFNVLITLILLLASTALLSSILIAVYFWIKGGFKRLDKDLGYSFLYALVLFPFVFVVLDKLMLGYMLALNFVVVSIAIYRS